MSIWSGANCIAAGPLPFGPVSALSFARRVALAWFAHQSLGLMPLQCESTAQTSEFKRKWLRLRSRGGRARRSRRKRARLGGHEEREMDGERKRHWDWRRESTADDSCFLGQEGAPWNTYQPGS